MDSGTRCETVYKHRLFANDCIQVLCRIYKQYELLWNQGCVALIR